MQLFKSNNNLFDLINSNYNLFPVLNRFGIRPGFKDKTVEDICKEKNINKDFFLAVINTYNNPDYFPEKELLGFSPVLIVNYLRKTHEYYLSYFIPKIENLLRKLISEGHDGNNDMKMIISFYEKCKNELLLHIQDEEENVFPMVIKLVSNNEINIPSRENPSFEKEHNNVEMKLSDLKNLIIKYLAPAYNDNDFNEFLATLFIFEKDLIDHARIEDKILVPQIIEIEKNL